MRGPFYVLAPDTRAFVQRTERRCGADPSTLLIDVPPAGGSPTMYSVLDAVLVALGKDDRLNPMRRRADLLARAWLSLREHSDGVLLDATQFSEAGLGQIIDLLTSHGLTPWLVFPTNAHQDPDELGELIDAVVDKWGGDIVEVTAFDERWPTPVRRRAPVDAAGGLPVLPRVDGVVFRRTCQQTLEPDDYLQIDKRLGDLVVELRSDIDSVGGCNKSRRLENLIRNRMHEIADHEELHLFVRALQIAALPLGFHVRVDPIMLLGASLSISRRAQAAHDGWWKQLDRYRDPDVGALAALYLAEIDLENVPNIRLNDIDDSGELMKVRVGDVDVEIDPAGRRFIRAMVAWRNLCDADPASPLYVPKAGTKRFTVSTAHLSGIGRETTDVNVPLMPSTSVPAKHLNAQQWLARFGISIAKLTKESRAA